MCSRFEGHSLGLIEALSYGIPCIACEGTYMVDEITKFNAGWCGSSDVEGVKKALLDMIEEKECFDIKSIGAKKLAAIYSWDYIAKKNHIVYSKIMSIENE